MLRCLRVLALVGCMLACVHSAAAQQSIDYGSVSGRVTDASGAVLAAAQVTARHAFTNLTDSTSTGPDGRFRFPYLRVGPYQVIITQAGFQTVTRSLTLAAGSAFELQVMLALGTADMAVIVTADAIVLEAARSQIAGTISETEVRNLPMNGRNFLDLALLVPGVSPTNVNSTQLFPETSAVPGITLSVGGQRNLSNNFSVDGLSVNDDAAGVSGITFGIDAIEQFQVVTSGGHAELGRALGGHVNVVTKSGTNVLHATAYEYLRDERLNARNALSRTKLPTSQSQYGVSVGGPIVSDRTFYFTNLEQRRLDQTGLVTITPENLAAINARLAAVGYQGPLVATGTYPNPVDSTNLLAKTDHEMSNRNRLGIRYSLYDIKSENSRGAGGLNASTASSALDNRDHGVAVSNTLTLSGRMVLETRAQAAHSDLQALATDPIGPSVAIAGVASFGTSSSSPTRRTNSMYQAVNNLSYHAGAHAFRLGVDVLHNADRITYPRSIRGSYTFSSLATYLTGAYNNAGFTQTFGVSEVVQTNPNLGLYVQDEWKASPRLTLNLGARYDLQFLQTVDTDTNNFSPRVGLAWSPFLSGGTVVRGNAGVFYDRVPLRPLANALLSAGNTTDLRELRQVSVSLSPTQVGAPTFPNTLTAIAPSITLPNLTTMDRELENALSRQASVEIEQQLGGRATVSVGYEYLRGMRLLMSLNQNVSACRASGTNNGCRPNPNYANNHQYSGVGESHYHGLHLTLMQRPTRWGHYRISYTLSKSMNNVGEFFFSSPIDPFDLSKDWGRSDNDQRHRLVVMGSLSSPDAPATLWARITQGFQLSGLLQAYSALPLNVTSGVTTIQGTAGRPIVKGAFIPRNAGIGSDFFSVSGRIARAVRVTRRVELAILAEGFNLTNRANVVTRNSIFGGGAYPSHPLSTFGQPTAVGEPRSFQFGLRATFDQGR
jgi:hypothetical protein